MLVISAFVHYCFIGKVENNVDNYKNDRIIISIVSCMSELKPIETTTAGTPRPSDPSRSNTSGFGSHKRTMSSVDNAMEGIGGRFFCYSASQPPNIFKSIVGTSAAGHSTFGEPNNHVTVTV